MDPIAAGALSTLASSVGTTLGQNAWAALGALVARRFRSRDGSPEPEQADQVTAGTGEVEFRELATSPRDIDKADRLADVLTKRAESSEDFERELDTWWSHTAQVLLSLPDNSTTNSISGTVKGPAVQGRDFTGSISFGDTRPPEVGR
jgi:hypothetical protein